ncbi:MAG: hypothetical protein ACXITR_13770 [Cyanobacterium sp.]
MIPSRLLQKNIHLLLPLCAVLFFIGNHYQKAIAQQIQVIGVSPFDETPTQRDINATTSHSIPPLPEKTPATDTIIINGNPTPARTPVPSNVKGIGSSQNLPSPPNLSEPYRAPDNSVSNIAPSPLNQTPSTTLTSTSASEVSNSSPNNAITVSSPPLTNNPSQPAQTNSPVVNSSETLPVQRRRSLREILVFDIPVVPQNTNTTPVNVARNNPTPPIGGAFRVFVRANNSTEESRVKEIYPEAFRANHQGNTVWQVGLFSTRQNAEQAAQPLRNAGFSPILSPVN